MAAIGMPKSVGVVDQDMNLLAGWAVFICGIERSLCNAEHSMPRSQMIKSTHDFRQTELSMIEIDVRATAVAGQKAAAYILWVVDRVALQATRFSVSILFDFRNCRSSGPIAIEVVAWANGEALDFSKQGMGGIKAGSTDLLDASDEVAKFNIGPAELWEDAFTRIRCCALCHVRPPPLGTGADD
jgi:hypothetical protein